MKKNMLAILALFSVTATFSQAKLAYIYGDDAYRREAQQKRKPPVQLMGDSALLISSALLMNVPADKMTITFGVSQTATQVLSANKQITERIEKFRLQLLKMGIPPDDIYVDFVSQNKVYEYELNNQTATEKETGFEIKKNVTISFTREALIDEMTLAAASQQIFDVIKVDYLIHDYTPYYKQLFAEAMKLIKDRRELYAAATGMPLGLIPSINTDDLTIVFPRTQYKKYTAYEAGGVEGEYRSGLIKKQLRKSSTAYYEGVSQHEFDKVINNARPGIYIQLALAVSCKYAVKK
jgi:uncharacterized protein YggE